MTRLFLNLSIPHMACYIHTELPDLTDAARAAGYVFGVLTLGALFSLCVLMVVLGYPLRRA